MIYIILAVLAILIGFLVWRWRERRRIEQEACNAAIGVLALLFDGFGKGKTGRK